MKKKISILGSTGSIGTQTLEVIRSLGNIEVLGLSANQNIELLEQQIREFHPRKVAVMDEAKVDILKDRVRELDVEVLYGMDGMIEIATMEPIEMVVTSVVGTIGLIPTLKAIAAKKNIALANKETLVTAGELVMEQAAFHNVRIYPVDSEHSAIFQCLEGNQTNPIHKLILTASGGPFRGKTREELKVIGVEDALKHPNWSMGKKITIDSATLMNKGLEVIEAKWLFQVDLDKIEVIVHPQSIIHSMVEFEDGSLLAQLGEPDMKIPIQYALTYPKRMKSAAPKLDFLKRSTFTFEKPDEEVFTCLRLSYEALAIGGTMPAVLNAANEVAVEAFLQKKIGFLDIPKLLKATMKTHDVCKDYTIEDILHVDQWARKAAGELLLRT